MSSGPADFTSTSSTTSTSTLNSSSTTDDNNHSSTAFAASTTEDDSSTTGTISTSTDANTSGSSTSSTEATSESMSTSTSSDTSTTEETTGSPTIECYVDKACKDPTKPFCYENQCVPCSDTDDPDGVCLNQNKNFPVCAKDLGTCVQCTPENPSVCTKFTQICDPNTFKCTGCTSHDQCLSGACNLSNGYCMDPDRTVYVDVNAICPTADGSSTNPYCELDAAITHISKPQNDPSLGWIIKVKPGDYISKTGPKIPPFGVVAIMGDGGTPHILAVNEAAISAEWKATLLLQNLSLLNNEGPGIYCIASNVWAERLIIQNNLFGYSSIDCNATFKNSIFYKNHYGGLYIFGGTDTKVINSFISENGQSGTDFDKGGILVGQGNKISLVYTSVIGNQGVNQANSLECVDGSLASVRNSILLDGNPKLPSIYCPNSTLETSILKDGKVDGDTNILATFDDLAMWFVPPQFGVYTPNYDNFILPKIAIWQSGDPTVDFSNHPRPSLPGAADYPGAIGASGN